MSRRLTTQQWVEKAIHAHGDKYDYSKVDYLGSKTKVTVICPIHGESDQNPSEHLRTSGCRMCGIEIMKKKTRLTTDQWVAQAKEIHGDKYDYSETIYTKMSQKLRIICPIHGSFEQWPQNHTQGTGCPFCGEEIKREKQRESAKARRTTTEEWIIRAREVHGEKYDYTMTVYTDVRTKLKVLCPIHGESEQLPQSHIKGSGCPECGEEIRRRKRALSTEQFVERARKSHGQKFDYSKVEYHNNATNVTIICPIHGEFEQLPQVHIESHGCSKCGAKAGADANRMTVEDFITAAVGVHGQKYDYSLVKEITNNRTNVLIGCEIHGYFEQRPDTHARRGQGCPKCVGRSLSTEDWIERFRGVHGQRYDYSRFEYTKAQEKSTIICKLHGAFEQVPASHYNGRGCPDCGIIERAANSAVGSEEFARRGREKFGDKFDYSKVEYVNKNTMVQIICEEHGPFFQLPPLHLKSATGCRECSRELGKATRYTTETWIAAATERHEGYYDYSKVEYTNSNDKVTIICPEHGEFQQVATNHVKGVGCWDCYRDRAGSIQRMSRDEVIERCKSVHGDYYDYSKVEYVNNRTEFTLTCPVHGDFETTFSRHFHQKGGCTGCAKHGYDRFAPGYYYVHNILNEHDDVIFIKGGISNDPESRFKRWSTAIRSMSRHKNHTTVVVHKAWFENGEDALDLERALLNEESIRYPPVPGMDGGTELFRRDPLLYALEEWDIDLDFVV